MPTIDQTNYFSNAATDIGGAVQSLFASKGASASASSFEEAAGIANQNAKIAAQETNIKETQLNRQIFQTIGQQRAQVGGAGFAESGSALDLLRSSASQGALAKAMAKEQGTITENSYAEQAGQFQGMAEAAKSSSTADTVGGVLQGAGGLYNLYKGATGLFNGTNAETLTAAAGAGIVTDTTALGASALVGAGGLGVDLAGTAGTVAAVGGDIFAGFGIEDLAMAFAF